MTRLPHGMCAGEQSDFAKHGLQLERASRNSWILMVLTFIVTTTGLAGAMFSLLHWRVGAPWPWIHTEMILLSGVCLVVLGFCLHLTLHHRRAAAFRTQLYVLEENKSRHLRSHYERMIALLDVSRTMTAETDSSKVFDRITRTCLEHFTCQQASLMLLKQETRELEVISAAGHGNSAHLIGARTQLGKGIAGWVAENKKPLVLGKTIDRGKYPTLDLSQPFLTAAMVVPICVRDQVVGVLNVATREPDVIYSEEDLGALQVFAENAGTCIRHVEQSDWMRRRIERFEMLMQARDAHEIVEAHPSSAG